FKAATRPLAPAGMEALTAANAYLETGDELVKKFAAEAVGDETDAVKCARLIETYVRKKISKKDFNVGFATAAETAKSFEGDCTWVSAEVDLDLPILHFLEGLQIEVIEPK